MIKEITVMSKDDILKNYENITGWIKNNSQGATWEEKVRADERMNVLKLILGLHRW